MKKVLMVGPARNVKGGMTTVVDNYFKYDLDKKVNLKYIETINDKNKVSKFLKEIKGMFEYYKSINNCDIVHIHMASRRSTYRKGKYVKIAKKKNKKVIIHIHGGGFIKFYEDECTYKEQEKVRNILNSADKIIVLSEEWKAYFERLIDKNKIIVIGNGTKIPQNFTKDVSNKDILYLGRINKEKGIYDLLDAISILEKKYSNLSVVIGGTGEEKKVKSYILKKNIKTEIKLLGWIDNNKKSEELKKCSYFILPSYYEGLPMSLIEAMSFKCISIGTNVGGIPKVIDNNENGLIIEPGKIDQIVNAFEYCFNNKEIRIKLSENARAKILKDFDIKTNINKTLAVYEEVMKD